MYRFICKVCGKEFEPSELGRECLDCVDQEYDVSRQCKICKDCSHKSC